MSMTPAGRARFRATILIYACVYAIAVVCDLVIQPIFGFPAWVWFGAGVTLALIAASVRYDVHAKINRKFGRSK